jgi:hypothetical protein
MAMGSGDREICSQCHDLARSISLLGSRGMGDDRREDGRFGREGDRYRNRSSHQYLPPIFPPKRSAN